MVYTHKKTCSGRGDVRGKFSYQYLGEVGGSVPGDARELASSEVEYYPGIVVEAPNLKKRKIERALAFHVTRTCWDHFSIIIIIVITYLTFVIIILYVA
jgi:hypothetical protein